KMMKAAMIVVPITLISWGFFLKTNDKSDDILIPVVLENLKNMHYSPITINDDFSARAFDHYMDYIDGSKRFLLQKDVDELAKYKKLIDDQSLAGSLEFFDKSVLIINQRNKVCETYFKEILAKPFDFTVDENVDFSEDLPYAKTEVELKERWRKYLKYNVMTRLATSMDVQEKAASKSKNEEEEFDIEPSISSMDDDEQSEVDLSVAAEDGATKSFEELEQKAREGVLKTHNDWFERMNRLERKDRLAVYTNAITTLFDPHTGYFPPADKDNFDIRMSGRLEGIGAQLQEKEGYIRVTSIVAGSPSAMQGELQANDLILKVGQGNEEAVDIVNAHIDDAVKLIRGKKGSTVKLTVQKPDGAIKVIPIVRDVVLLEETYAKSVLINDADNRKIGYINLPSFYTDFTGGGGRTSWKDVRDELKKLNANNAEALIFDLRNNGGGSLNDVVDMTGLFIEKGPIVQVKDKQHDPYIMRDNDGSIEWNKPVIIMVNEFSASASEIMAAAMQDYGRAIIVGSNSTHGKGTVQRFIDLNQTLRSNDYGDLGSLKLTTQKFYRINGESTQLKGVTPDIIWPDNYTYIPTGEQEQDNAMKWDKISGTSYKVLHDVSTMKDLKKESDKRTKANPIFTELEVNAKRWKTQSETKVQTLNLVKYRNELKERKKVSDQFSKMFKSHDDVQVTTLLQDAKEIGSDTVKLKRAADWHKGLMKDVYLYETLQIAEDMLKTSK
ncbi:MAG: carboxyl-terminal processing protease, partial [Bacteroidia bacterium]